jgi:hypothetical protein
MEWAERECCSAGMPDTDGCHGSVVKVPGAARGDKKPGGLPCGLTDLATAGRLPLSRPRLVLAAHVVRLSFG